MKRAATALSPPIHERYGDRFPALFIGFGILGAEGAGAVKMWGSAFSFEAGKEVASRGSTGVGSHFGFRVEGELIPSVSEFRPPVAGAATTLGRSPDEPGAV